MDDSLIAVALLALSTVLIIAEIFIPSGGLLAIGTFFSMLASVYYAWQAWGTTSPGFFFGFVGFSVVFLPGVVVGSFAVLPYTPFGKRILLEGPSAEEVVPHSHEEEKLQSYVGQIVKTGTPLTPNGFVLIGYERVNACSEGVIIDSGKSVKVIKLRGTQLVVREVDEPETQTQQSPTAPDLSAQQEVTETSATEDNPLDFDLPQNG